MHHLVSQAAVRLAEAKIPGRPGPNVVRRSGRRTDQYPHHDQRSIPFPILLPGLDHAPYWLALNKLCRRGHLSADVLRPRLVGPQALAVFCAQPPKAGDLGTWDFGPLTPLPRQAGGWVVR